MKFQQKTYTLRCPQCSRAMKTPFTPIVTDREAVLTDAFFTAACKCGCRAAVSAPCLYYDERRGAMLYLLPEASAQAWRADTLTRAFPEVAGYQKRIVTSVPQLREKIRLLEFGLDDRAVEMAKLAVAGWAAARRAAHVRDVYFAELDEAERRISFYLYTDRSAAPMLYRARSEVYDASRDIAATLPQPSDFCRIDMRWAAHTLVHFRETKEA